MKEFVEKLIERLEENIEELSGWNHHKVNAYSNAVRIVKQLAEEYNSSKSSCLEEQIADDLSAVLKEAKSMGCTEVKYFHHIPLENVEIVINALRAYSQDSTKKNQGWIPCSERLPEIGKSEFYPDVIITDKNGVVEVAFYNEYDKAWYVMNAYSQEYEIKKDVIAWMPLPEAYKPEEKPQTNFYVERFNRVN